MKKISLHERATYNAQIDDGNESQYLAFNNVSIDAEIKIELSRENEKTERTIPKMKLISLLEIQNKIESVERGRPVRPFEFITSPTKDGTTLTAFRSSFLDIAHGGELVLSSNDKVDISLSSLGGVSSPKGEADSSMILVGGRSTSAKPFVVTEMTMLKDTDEKEIDLTSLDYLAFNSATVPRSITLIENGQKVEYDFDMISMIQHENFGVVGYDVDKKPIIGSYTTYVLPVFNATSVYVHNVEGQTKDVKFFGVKIPR